MDNSKLWRYVIRLAATDYMLLKASSIVRIENGTDDLIASWIAEAKEQIDKDAQEEGR